MGRRMSSFRQWIVRSGSGTAWGEWLVGCLGFVTVAGTAGYLVWTELHGSGVPPAFSFEVIDIRPAGNRWAVRVRVSNDGTEAAQDLTIEAQTGLAGGRTGPLLTLPRLAGGSSRTASFLLQEKPDFQDLSFEAKSFSTP